MTTPIRTVVVTALMSLMICCVVSPEGTAVQASTGGAGYGGTSYGGGDGGTDAPPPCGMHDNVCGGSCPTSSTLGAGECTLSAANVCSCWYQTGSDD